MSDIPVPVNILEAAQRAESEAAALAELVSLALMTPGVDLSTLSIVTGTAMIQERLAVIHAFLSGLESAVVERGDLEPPGFKPGRPNKPTPVA